MSQSPPAGSIPRDVALGAGAGVLSGLLGVGGGVLLVTILVLVLRWQQKSAQATALVLVMMAAISGVTTYAVAGSVAWGPAAIVFCGAIVGALVGSAVVQRVHAYWLQVAFGAVLVLAAIRLVWPTGGQVDSLQTPPALTPGLVVAYVASGLAMGLLSTFSASISTIATPDSCSSSTCFAIATGAHSGHEKAPHWFGGDPARGS